MGIVRKYQFYKRCLQVLLAVNVFFIMFGVVGVIRYFGTFEPAASDLMIVGFGTLVFGIVAPVFLIGQLMNTVKEMRRQSEEALAAWVSGWMENYRSFDEDPLKNPHFWLNMALVTAEVFGENSRHPVVRMVAEFAPIMKAELKKEQKKAARARKSVA